MAQDTRKQLRIQGEVLDPWKAIAERARRSLTKQAELVLAEALPAWQERRSTATNGAAKHEPKAAAR